MLVSSNISYETDPLLGSQGSLFPDIEYTNDPLNGPPRNIIQCVNDEKC